MKKHENLDSISLFNLKKSEKINEYWCFSYWWCQLYYPLKKIRWNWYLRFQQFHENIFIWNSSYLNLAGIRIQDESYHLKVILFVVYLNSLTYGKTWYAISWYFIFSFSLLWTCLQFFECIHLLYLSSILSYNE